MPETTIGFFPDVGASFFLSRMEGGLGLYLALTSERLKGPETYLAGVATHYLHSSSLPDLEARLAELQFKDYASMEERVRIIDRTIEEFSTGLPHDQSHHLPVAIRRLIDDIFHEGATVPSILVKLKQVSIDSRFSEPSRQWAAKTLETIRERSPTSVAVTQRMLKEAKEWSILEAFQHEYYIACRFMEHQDFVTGVTARLIEKTKGRPAWDPSTLEELSMGDVDSFFTKNPTGLDVLNKDPAADYHEYAYGDVFLPTERRIKSDLRDVIAESAATANPELLEHVLDDAHKNLEGRTGVREKYKEVLSRMLLPAIKWDRE